MGGGQRAMETKEEIVLCSIRNGGGPKTQLCDLGLVGSAL